VFCSTCVTVPLSQMQLVAGVGTRARYGVCRCHVQVLTFVHGLNTSLANVTFVNFVCDLFSPLGRCDLWPATIFEGANNYDYSNLEYSASTFHDIRKTNFMLLMLAESRFRFTFSAFLDCDLRPFSSCQAS